MSISALDHLASAAGIVSEARKAFEDEKASLEAKYQGAIKALEDRILAAELKATMHADMHMKEREGRAAAERITAKLLAQFGAVSKIFEEAKSLAEQVLAEAEFAASHPQEPQWTNAPSPSSQSPSSPSPSDGSPEVHQTNESIQQALSQEGH